MNNDAQEAAMGLLSLSPSNVIPPPMLVPQKRKHPPRDQQHQPVQQGGLKKRSSSKTVHQHRQEMEKEREVEVEVENVQGQGQEQQADMSSESISCICGSTYDDGFSIACDVCLRWCHGACFGIMSNAEAPDEWRCWVCLPRPVDREEAAKLQRVRQEEHQRVERERAQQQQHLSSHQHRRRTSPGVDRKHRRTSANTVVVDGTNNGNNGHKRKRRGSMVAPPPPALVEDDLDVVVDIDEPWSYSYVHITEDVVPSVSTREKLQRHAQNWRGITAIQPFPPPPVTVHPLPDPACVRPPAYAVHTTAPIPSEAIITPYTSTITPSSEYLANPLNAYAHLGMPKPFVHLMGPPLDLALDARVAGDSARFVRSGCRPNAVLRPVLCRKGSRGVAGQETDANQATSQDSDPGTLAFAVFALRDLKAHEEVVLGWEWDDGNAVHALPALIKTPDMFPPAKHSHLRAQMSNILHLLGSTFTTCACGAHSRDCALTQMERFVDGRGWGRGRGEESEGEPVDVGPLLGRARGFRTRERVRGSGGLTGVEMDVGEDGRVYGDRDVVVEMGTGDGEETEDELEPGVWDQDDSQSTRAAKLRARDLTLRTSTQPDPHTQKWHTHTQLRPPDPDPGPDITQREETEEKMPPKMRKRWIKREKQVLRETYGHDESDPTGSGGRDRDIEMGDVSTSSGDAASGRSANGEQDELVHETTQRDSGTEHPLELGSSEHPPPQPTTAGSGPSAIPLTSIKTHLLHLPPPTASPSASFARLSLTSPSDSWAFRTGLSGPPTAVVVGSPQVLQSAESLARKVGGGFGLGIGHGRRIPHSSMSSAVEVSAASTSSLRARLESTSPLESESMMAVHVSPDPRTFCKDSSQDVDASPPPSAECSPPPQAMPKTQPIPLQGSSPLRDEPLDPPEASPAHDFLVPSETLVDVISVAEASTSTSSPSLPPASLPHPHPQTLPTFHPNSRWASPEPSTPWVPDAYLTAHPYRMTASISSPSPAPEALTVAPVSPSGPSSTQNLSPDFRLLSPEAQRSWVIWGTAPRLLTPPPPRDPTPPPPPPPPKVKLSLKDFALRKRKQREEEKASASIGLGSARRGSVEASPVVGSVGLAGEGGSGEVGAGEGEHPRTTDGAGATDSGAGETHHGACESHEVEMGEVHAKSTNDGVSSAAVAGGKLGDFEHQRDIRTAETLPPPSVDALPRPVASNAAVQIKDEDVEMPDIDNTAGSIDELHTTSLPKPSIVSSVHLLLPADPMYDAASLQAKMELIDQPLLTAIPEYDSRPSSEPPRVSGAPATSRPPSDTAARRASSPSPSLDTQSPSSHPQSQEDGEITSAASSPLPMRNISPVNTRRAYIPYSFAPPTQPRSFQMMPSSSTSPPPSRRQSMPIYRSPAPPATTPTPALRLPPSGPRALRMGNNNYLPPRPPYPSRPIPLGPSATTNDWDSRRVPLGPSANRESLESDRDQSTPTTPRQLHLSAAVPRGPSADREKLDCDRERSWGPRSRAKAGGGLGGAGWGR